MYVCTSVCVHMCMCWSYESMSRHDTVFSPCLPHPSLYLSHCLLLLLHYVNWLPNILSEIKLT